MIEHIIDQNRTICIIIRSSYEKNGIEFFTPPEFSQQLAFIKRPKGYNIQPHVHNKVFRNVVHTQEVLFIKSGKLRVDFYDEKQDYLESKILEAGDTILLASGGHGFEVLEDLVMIEVKQGPYTEKADKTRFDGIHIDQVVIKKGSDDV